MNLTKLNVITFYSNYSFHSFGFSIAFLFFFLCALFWIIFYYSTFLLDYFLLFHFFNPSALGNWFMKSIFYNFRMYKLKFTHFPDNAGALKHFIYIYHFPVYYQHYNSLYMYFFNLRKLLFF